jgi:small-conductance mechanosensitive channel
LATFLGLFSAGMAIALKDPVANLAGWGFIIWRRPFELGDRIQIGEYAGDVVDIRIFQFTLLEIGNWVDSDQSTGRIIHVPNSKVFFESLANYTMEFNYIWNEIPVRITFESNWMKAKKLLLEIVNRHADNISDTIKEQVHHAARRFLIIYTKFTPIVYTSVKEYGVCLTIRYMCEPRRRRSSEEIIWEDILKSFAQEPDIEFAYPTQRFFRHHIESKKVRSDHDTPHPSLGKTEEL